MKVLAVIAAILGALVVAYVIAYPTYTFRYLLTVEVEVNGIVKSGSSVIEIRWITIPTFIPTGIGKSFDIQIHGEAVYVDLGPRGPLIVTLTTDSAPDGCQTCRSVDQLPFQAFNLSADRRGISALSAQRSAAPVPLAMLPGLVTLGDVTDPKSIRPVAPDAITQIFGPGVRLRSATIEPTQASVTRRLHEKLPWLKGMTPSTPIVQLRNTRHAQFYAINLIGME